MRSLSLSLSLSSTLLSVSGPGAELLAQWNVREAALVARNPPPVLADVLHTRPFAQLPEPKGDFTCCYCELGVGLS